MSDSFFPSYTISTNACHALAVGSKTQRRSDGQTSRFHEAGKFEKPLANFRFEPLLRSWSLRSAIRPGKMKRDRVCAGGACGHPAPAVVTVSGRTVR
jgi:hypothetical protein